MASLFILTFFVLIYMFNGVVYYGNGLAMLAGMLLGGYIGTHIAVRRGKYRALPCL